MNKPQKKYSKKALACLEQMSQGKPPSRAEFIAAWNAGLINTTEEGERIILEPCTTATS